MSPAGGGSVTPLYFDCGDPDLTIHIYGDADGNYLVNTSDAVRLIAYLYGDAPAPEKFLCGDGDCNEIVELTDVIIILNYVFYAGTDPGGNCD